MAFGLDLNKVEQKSLPPPTNPSKAGAETTSFTSACQQTQSAVSETFLSPRTLSRFRLRGSPDSSGSNSPKSDKRSKPKISLTLNPDHSSSFDHTSSESPKPWFSQRTKGSNRISLNALDQFPISVENIKKRIHKTCKKEAKNQRAYQSKKILSLEEFLFQEKARVHEYLEIMQRDGSILKIVMRRLEIIHALLECPRDDGKPSKNDELALFLQKMAKWDQFSIPEDSESENSDRKIFKKDSKGKGLENTAEMNESKMNTRASRFELFLKKDGMTQGKDLYQFLIDLEKFSILNKKMYRNIILKAFGNDTSKSQKNLTFLCQWKVAPIRADDLEVSFTTKEAYLNCCHKLKKYIQTAVFQIVKDEMTFIPRRMLFSPSEIASLQEKTHDQIIRAILPDKHVIFNCIEINGEVIFQQKSPWPTLDQPGIKDFWFQLFKKLDAHGLIAKAKDHRILKRIQNEPRLLKKIKRDINYLKEINKGIDLEENDAGESFEELQTKLFSQIDAKYQKEVHVFLNKRNRNEIVDDSKYSCTRILKLLCADSWTFQEQVFAQNFYPFTQAPYRLSYFPNQTDCSIYVDSSFSFSVTIKKLGRVCPLKKPDELLSSEDLTRPLVILPLAWTITVSYRDWKATTEILEQGFEIPKDLSKEEERFLHKALRNVVSPEEYRVMKLPLRGDPKI